jgi:actin, other eukaryote
MAAFEDDDITLVIGTHRIDAGFAGDDAPRASFPPIIGRPKHHGIMVGMPRADWVGDEAQARRAILNITSPLSPLDGTVENWEDMERILHHTFYNELREAPEEHPVLIGEPPLNPPEKREEMAQMLFETFNVPACHLAVDAMLGLLSSGHTKGIVVDLGHGHGHAVPFGDDVPVRDLPGFDPLEVSDESFALNFPELLSPPVRIACGAGELLSQELWKRLADNRVMECNTNAEREICRDMKEKCCQVTRRTDSDGGYFPEKEYELPDGEKVVLPHECRSVPDLLFRPSLMTLRSDDPLLTVDPSDVGIVEAIMSAASTGPDDLLENVVLIGGTSMFPHLAERLRQELSGKDKVDSQPERKYATWIGGSIFASLSTMQHLWVTKEHYDEEGPRVVNSRWPPPSEKFAGTGTLTKAAGKRG